VTASPAKTEGLAIHGGPKVRPTPMPPRSAFGDEELAVIVELFEHYRSRGVDFGYQDTYERRYTEAFVRHLGAGGYADAVATGTAALYVAVAALRLPVGSHVLVSPITDPGTLSAIILNQLVPVLMDSAPGSWNTSVDEFVARVTPETRAAVLVHAAGRAADVGRISRAARDRGVLLVEDCSQAHGARHEGARVGTFGDLACFSTMYRKAHATGGCGGVVFTRDLALHRMALACADRGKPSWEPSFNEKDPTTFLFPALNLHQDEIACAIGLRSLEKLDETIRRRLAFRRALDTLLVARSTVCRPSETSDDDSPFFHPIVVDSRKLSCSKREFAEAVRAEGVDLNPHYAYVVVEWPWMAPYLADDFACPNAVATRDASFNILFNERYSEREADDIVRAILKVEEAYAR